MVLAVHAFLLVTILGVVGLINGGEPVSDLTLQLILFILPTVIIFSFYASGSFDSILNRKASNNNHGTEPDRRG